ncbi:MAG: hypothetical protein LAT76_04410 [Schleiferiaceae bacterium]|nr:hypothetical protein [Schleiferiaceae bacterium]
MKIATPLQKSWYVILSLACASLMGISSCDSQQNEVVIDSNSLNSNTKQTASEELGNTELIKQYFENGTTLKATVTMQGDRKQGPEVLYYKNGQKQTEGSYLAGKKEGVFTTYTETGVRYRSVTYADGIMDGWDSVFYESGTPKYAIPFRNGQVIPGTKEWNAQQEEIAQPSIIIQEINELKTEGRFTITAQFAGAVVSPKYFIGILGNGTPEKPEHAFQAMDSIEDGVVLGKYDIIADDGFTFVGKIVIKGIAHTERSVPFVRYQVFPITVR